jgi:cytidyltransferase-like protein
MSAPHRIGLLGGTFDPIHFGHLDAAEAARIALHLDEIRLIPSYDPQHRTGQPRATSFHRFALVALAIGDRAAYRVSDTDVQQDPPIRPTRCVPFTSKDGARCSFSSFLVRTRLQKLPHGTSSRTS